MRARVARRAQQVWAEAPWLGYALAPAGVALVSLVIALIRLRVHIPNISNLYLVVILALASTVGRGPAIFASLLAFFTYDFFFTEPYYTFTIREPAEWLALVVFFLVAVVAGQLTAALRARAEEARRRERDNAALYRSLNQALEARAAEAQRRERITATLYELSRALATKQEPDQLLDAIAARVVAVLGVRSCAILLPDERGRLAVRASAAAGGGPVAPLDRNEEAQVTWLFTHVGEHRLRPSRYRQFLHVPLDTGERRLGVLRVEAAARGTPLGDADAQLLATFAAQAALALEQARLAQEAVRAAILARGDELKDALLASVSHDLRTPLAAIRAAAGSLLQEDIEWDPETRREFAATIDEEAARLNRLVGALLDMSRLEAGALRARTGLYPLDDLVRPVVARLAPRAADRPIAVDLPADLPPVPLDPVQIDQVLTNLLENALKYSPAGTPIAVTATREGGAMVVRVADRGPGIPRHERAHVFDKFYRLRAAAPGAGSGLGLAIARGLVEAHGGHIWVEDTPGGGATFAFALPLEPAAGRARPPGLAPAGREGLRDG
ncbi:MAG TPA: ATP-binding protein [Thermomicrobiales bacterium]|nr:ATP-binding protein [Thermomicrobiales bacterium]